jgi:hypothetical protein
MFSTRVPPEEETVAAPSPPSPVLAAEDCTAPLHPNSISAMKIIATPFLVPVNLLLINGQAPFCRLLHGSRHQPENRLK